MNVNHADILFDEPCFGYFVDTHGSRSSIIIIWDCYSIMFETRRSPECCYMLTDWCCVTYDILSYPFHLFNDFRCNINTITY